MNARAKISHPPVVGAGAARDAGSVRDSVAESGLRSAADEARIVRAMSAHFNLVWRALRRFGVSASAADDAAQQVFLIFARRLTAVELGHERAFLLSVAVGVASNERRARSRSREVLSADEPEPDAELERDPEQLLVDKQRREELDRVLDELPHEQRVVFVLYEMEGFSLPEISTALGIPLGTATSRLARGRDRFEHWVRTHQAARDLP